MIYVGIDVAKSKHDCCILNEKGEALSTFVFTNDKQGFEKLMAEIRMYSSADDLSDARIGLESTGHYSINLQNYLLQKRPGEESPALTNAALGFTTRFR